MSVPDDEAIVVLPDDVIAQLARLGLRFQHGDYVRKNGAPSHWYLRVDSEKMLPEPAVRYGWDNR